ncbi:MAG: electron transfer flavoprotein subunit alpha/FixB family protein [Deltaproteobacteria bacterium]|nr:electron transfer flavoprotein subunit alpha/FixB family protein [Deltaproteobacteria bacterium]
MTEICAFVEYAGDKIQRVSQEAVSEAVRQSGRLGARCTALVLGHRIPPGIFKDLRRFGVDRALACDEESLAEYSTGRYAGRLAQIIRERAPDLLLMGSSAMSRDLAPRLSARLGRGLVTEATFLDFRGGELHVTRAAYRPHASMIFSFQDPGLAIVTLAPKVAEAERIVPKDRFLLESPEPGVMPLSLRDDRVRIERAIREIPSEVDLTDAEVVVAGGKGMMDGKNFRLLEELAGVLGGVVAATRMAVDMKWVPRECMVGVTGKTVSPGLYVACGISGAIQHRMGMQSSETVVAINTDPNAPIFRIATLGIVGDVRDVLPVMIEEFRKAGDGSGHRERSA